MSNRQIKVPPDPTGQKSGPKTPALGDSGHLKNQGDSAAILDFENGGNSAQKRKVGDENGPSPLTTPEGRSTKVVDNKNTPDASNFENAIDDITTAGLDSWAAMRDGLVDLDSQPSFTFVSGKKICRDELFVFREDAARGVELISGDLWRKFRLVYAKLLGDEILNENGVKVKCNASFVSGGVGRFLCDNRESANWIQETVRNIKVNLDENTAVSFIAYRRGEQGAIKKFRFFVPGEKEEPDDDRLATIIKTQNRMKGLFRIVSSHECRSVGRNDKGGWMYHALLSSESVDVIRQKNNPNVGVMEVMDKGLIHVRLSSNILRKVEKNNEKKKPQPDNRKQTEASVAPLKKKKPVKSKNAKEKKVEAKKFEIDFSNEEYWGFTKSKRQRIRKAALKAGVNLDVGDEPEWHKQQQRESNEAKRTAALSQEAGGNDADVVDNKNKSNKQNVNANLKTGSSATGPASAIPMEVDEAVGSPMVAGTPRLPPPKSGSAVSSKQDL